MTTTEIPRVRFNYVRVNDVYGALAGGGGVYIEEYPRGEIGEAAKIAGRRADTEETTASLVIGLTADTVGGAPHDTVWFHPDQDDRLAVIARARAALDAAEAALEAVGYVDKAHMCAADYRTAGERARNAFEIGRDFEGGQQRTS